MKKRLVALILAGLMVCSLTACGGDKTSETTDSAESTTTAATETSAETPEATSEDKSEKSSVMVYYGWGSDDEEKYTSEIFCPEGAVFSEKNAAN